jgi:hypothetical protein
MKNIEKNILQVISFLLILLWMYAALSKLFDFSSFKEQMGRQVLFPLLKNKIVYLLPPLEILTALLFLFDFTQKIALYISLIMLSAFTIYIALGVFKVFARVPCSCGGILHKLGWTDHLIFNFIFLLLTAVGLYIKNREGRMKISSVK